MAAMERLVDKASRKYGKENSTFSQVFADRYSHRMRSLSAPRYVGCRADRAVSGEWAERTARQRLGVDVTWLDGSHSPFLADPGGLGDLLSTLTQ
jgi:hypothetical protein